MDFASARRPERPMWTCHCGGFSFRLYAGGSAVCDRCGNEAAALAGLWQIRPMATADCLEAGDNVVPLNPGAADVAREERALMEAALQLPLTRGLLERGGMIICSAERTGQD